MKASWLQPTASVARTQPVVAEGLDSVIHAAGTSDASESGTWTVRVLRRCGHGASSIGSPYAQAPVGGSFPSLGGLAVPRDWIALGSPTLMGQWQVSRGFWCRRDPVCQ